MGNINNLCSICTQENTPFSAKDRMSTVNLYNEDVIKQKTKQIMKIQNNWRKFKSISKTLVLMKSKLKKDFDDKYMEISIEELNSKIRAYYNNDIKEIEKSDLEKLKFCLTVKLNPLIVENDAIYSGEWNIQGEMHGLGILITYDGTIYQGIFENGLFNGRGQLIECNGDIYIGDFLNGKKHGKGKFIQTNGTTYTGEWQSNLQEGYGQEDFVNGSHFQGNFLKGEKNGYGVFKFSDGSSYEGFFSKNMLNGKGTYRWSDKRIYKGDWIENKMEGNGVFTWPDGKRYEGAFKNDKREGFGILRYSKKKYYEGMFCEGKKHGVGSLHTGRNVEKGVWNMGVLVKDYTKNNIISEIDENKFVKEKVEKGDNFFEDYNKFIKNRTHINF